MAETIPSCRYMALPQFRKASGKKLTDCVREPYHEGNHVYCLPVREGVDHRSYALHYFEEVKRTKLKPVMNVDMDGHVREANEEMCVSVWQIMEYQKGRQG